MQQSGGGQRYFHHFYRITRFAGSSKNMPATIIKLLHKSTGEAEIPNFQNASRTAAITLTPRKLNTDMPQLYCREIPTIYSDGSHWFLGLARLSLARCMTSLRLTLVSFATRVELRLIALPATRLMDWDVARGMAFLLILLRFCLSSSSPLIVTCDLLNPDLRLTIKEEPSGNGVNLTFINNLISPRRLIASAEDNRS